MFGLILLAGAFAAQPTPAASGAFSADEIRTMCRGEGDEGAEFRTDAAFRLFVNYQRSRCRMYLLGVADGMIHSARLGEPGLCLPPGLDRERLADQLTEALLSEQAAADSSLPAIVERLLRSESRCR